MTSNVRTGIDVFLNNIAHRMHGKRIGLITNQTGVTADLEGNIAVFRRLFGEGLCALFSPEHGLYAHVQDRERIRNFIDPESGLPVYSLYGLEESPSDSVLQDLDILLFDIQCVGVRFYTYLTSMSYTLKAAAVQNMPVMILDRPNPITGTRIAGPMIDKCLTSFEGACETPVMHGMTLGELALFLNETSELNACVEVVPMEGWIRSMWYEDTGLAWVSPSPNMPTVDTAVLYPGMCLFEATNLSEGRGTTRPFEQVGAPWIEANRLTTALNARALPGVRFRAAHFLPTFWKLQGTTCHGVQVYVTDREAFEPIMTGLTMIKQILEFWPEDFQWIRLEHDTQYFFDRLIGNNDIRPQLNSHVSVEEIVDSYQDDEAMFREIRQPFLLYDK